jgi:hypothetical protein
VIGVGKRFFQRFSEVGPVVSTILCVAQREAVDLIAYSLSKAWINATTVVISSISGDLKM